MKIFYGAGMSGISPMVKKIRQMPGTVGGTGTHKFNIPKRGRIRAALVLALAAAVVVLIFKRGGDGSDNDVSINDNAVSTDTAIAKQSLSTIAKKSNGKNNNADDKKNTTVTNTKSPLDTTGIDTSITKPKRLFFLSCNNEPRRITTDKQERKPERKQVPDGMMSFDDVRKLISGHNVTPTASEQIVVTENTQANTKGRRGKDKDACLDTLTLSLSIDTMLQKYAQSMLRRYKPRYGAVAAIDPATGRVLALASFANEDEEMDGGALYLKSVFPAASVFKTVVAAAGIERGNMNAKTNIQHFGRHHTLYTTQIEENLKVSRDITLQDAFAYSINPVFARIALFHVNKDIVFDMGKRYGFNETIPFEYDIENSVMFYPDSAFSVAEFASGFNRQTSISPIAGALIAAAASAGGVIYEPSIIDSIRSSNGDTLVYKREPAVWRRVMKEHSAKELRILMTSVTRYGTARKTFRPLLDSPKYREFEFGGKTGNVNKAGLGRVDWYVGYARNPSDKKQQIAIGVVTTHGEYWTVQSSYITSELMKKYIQSAISASKSGM